MPNAPEFSAIITCFNEEHTIDTFHERLAKAFADSGRSCEFILVNDGSRDDTLSKLDELFRRDKHISAVIDLFKNSGQAAAATAGLTYASGSILLFIDSDLQLDPASLPALIAEIDNGCDVVSGYRVDRKDSLFRIIPSKLANLIMRRVSKSAFRDFGCTFKLFNADLVRAFDFGPHHLFNPPMVISKAKNLAEVPVEHSKRPYGKSGWTFRKLWHFNMDNIVNLSRGPFQIAGALCLLIGFVFAARLLVEVVLPIQVLSNVTHGLLLNVAVISLLVIVGVLCIVGEFTIRSFFLLQRYPHYIIKNAQVRDDADR